MYVYTFCSPDELRQRVRLQEAAVLTWVDMRHAAKIQARRNAAAYDLRQRLNEGRRCAAERLALYLEDALQSKPRQPTGMPWLNYLLGRYGRYGARRMAWAKRVKYLRRKLREKSVQYTIG